MTSSPTSNRARALAWDPTSPFTCSIASSNLNDTNEASLDILLSHDGTGIHPLETTCLSSLLDARDAWLESNTKHQVSHLSVDYRRALCECLIQLKQDDEASDNYESLALMYAMMHLNEVYLLPASSTVDRLDGAPGSLTANTIRYLRTHHTPYDVNSDGVRSLLEMDQPEYYTPDATTPIDDPLLVGPFDQPYYNLVFHLINLGQVVNAWSVLTRHSSCRRAEEESMRGSINKEGNGWSALRAVLLSAPLPGGRGDQDDSGLIPYNEEEEEDDEDDEGIYYERCIDEISPGSTCLWEENPKVANRERNQRYHRQCIRRGADLPKEEVEVLPERYTEGVAMNTFSHWQRVARSHMQPGRMGDHVCGALFSRFPQLEQICSVLLGRPPVGGASWSELLVSELLYSRPNIAPGDIAVRARVAMGHCGVEIEGQESMVLKVMEGSAGDVISSMFDYGGASGAALPATLTSLLSDVLIDSGIITLPSIQTEILLSAAESIVSSFSVQGQLDVGVRTAVRLLLPHAPPKHIGEEICYEPRIAAFISETISRRFPDSDAEAHNLLNMTEEMIRRGSVRIADACESVAFCRASHHASKKDISRLIYWLLRGIEIMSVWLPADYRRTLGFASRRLFDMTCKKSSEDLLSCLSAMHMTSEENVEKLTGETALALNCASKILEAVLQDDSMADALRDSVDVALLYHIVNIALRQAENDNTQMAEHIVHCLEERSSGGSVTTLANSNMYLRLIEIAVGMMNEEEKVLSGSLTAVSCSFSVHGLHILMARMDQVSFWEGKNSDRIEYLSAMKMILCKGLMRSFASDPKADLKRECIRAGTVSLDEEIASMLDPSVS